MSLSDKIADFTSKSGPLGSIRMQDLNDILKDVAEIVGDQVAVELGPSELNTLNTSPVEIIPAPGAGKAIKVISVEERYRYNTAAYTMQGNSGLFANVSSFPMIVTSFGVDQDWTVFHSPGLGGTGNSYPLQENQPLSAFDDIGDSTTTGDGICTLIVNYTIVDL